MLRGRDLVITGAAVMGPTGSFDDGISVVVRDGVVAAVGRDIPRGLEVVDLAGHWLMPGVHDCHSHVFWNQFHAADRERLPLTYRTAAAARSLEATLRAGVTSVRDAGGADAGLRDAVRDGLLVGPRLAISIEIIDGDSVTGADDMRRRVREVVAAGATWVKLAATRGVMGPEGTELEATLDADELRAAVAEASAGGARVMVHAWGGPAVTDAIAAGVASIEHAIFLTEEQAQAAVAADVTIVPTLEVYREVHALALAGALPDFVVERTERVARAHPESVRMARAAGVRIALGSDFASPDQHGRNLEEIAALAEAGLGIEGALVAATRAGAGLLAETGVRGAIEPGAVFDAVVLGREPSHPEVFRDRSAVTGVYLAGIPVAAGDVTH